MSRLLKLLDFENKWPFYLVTYIVAGLFIDNFFSATFFVGVFLLMMFILSTTIVYILGPIFKIIGVLINLITLGKLDSSSLGKFADEIEENGHYLAIPLTLLILYILKDDLSSFFNF